MAKEQLKFHQLSLVSNSEAEPEFDRSEFAEDYGAEVEACERCHGTGMEIVPQRGARTCECRKLKSYEKLFQAARIPRRYEKCSLQNFKPREMTQSRAKALSFDLAQS